MEDDDRKYVEISKEIWRRLLEGYGGRNFNVRFWNGEVWEADGKPNFTLVLNHPGSLRAAMLPPTELNLAEAYLYGDIDTEGEIEAIFPVADFVMNNGPGLIDKLGIARLLMSLPKKKMPRVGKREPARLKGKKHCFRNPIKGAGPICLSRGKTSMSVKLQQCAVAGKRTADLEIPLNYCV